MELNRVTAAIETILFAMGDSVEIGTIAKALEISEEEVREAVHALEERCNEPQSGLMINWFEHSVQISIPYRSQADRSTTSTWSK